MRAKYFTKRLTEKRVDPEMQRLYKSAKAKYPQYDEETALLKHLADRDEKTVGRIEKDVDKLDKRVTKLEKNKKLKESTGTDEAGIIVAEVVNLIGEGHTEVSPDVITTKVSAALGRPFMLKDLVAANNRSPELQHYIDSINPSKIKFSTDILTVKNQDPMKEKEQAQATVANMAARAANRPRLGEAADQGLSKDQETEFHKELDDLVHRTFGKRKEEMKEDAEELNVGDDVIITGPVEHEGETGVIDSFGQDKSFVVVNLYNHGKKSFHSSDVSFNDYAGSDEEEAEMYDRDPEFRDWAARQDVDEGWGAEPAAARHREQMTAVAQVLQKYKNDPVKSKIANYLFVNNWNAQAINKELADPNVQQKFQANMDKYERRVGPVKDWTDSMAQDYLQGEQGLEEAEQMELPGIPTPQQAMSQSNLKQYGQPSWRASTPTGVDGQDEFQGFKARITSLYKLSPRDNLIVNGKAEVTTPDGQKTVQPWSLVVQRKTGAVLAKNVSKLNDFTLDAVFNHLTTAGLMRKQYANPLARDHQDDVMESDDYMSLLESMYSQHLGEEDTKSADNQQDQESPDYKGHTHNVRQLIYTAKRRYPLAKNDIEAVFAYLKDEEDLNDQQQELIQQLENSLEKVVLDNQQQAEQIAQLVSAIQSKEKRFQDYTQKVAAQNTPAPQAAQGAQAIAQTPQPPVQEAESNRPDRIHYFRVEPYNADVAQQIGLKQDRGGNWVLYQFKNDSKFDRKYSDAVRSFGQPRHSQSLNEADTPLRDREDYDAKHKALQDLQLDPNTSKDPELSAEVIRRLAGLKQQAKDQGVDVKEAKRDPYKIISDKLKDIERERSPQQPPADDQARAEQAKADYKKYVEKMKKKNPDFVPLYKMDE